ncbi:cytochrome P450 [Bradyrhizobium canariense]|jgi:hypothetical protein|nr:cytochrome P450 [Bradyrhizobium canariense]
MAPGSCPGAAVALQETAISLDRLLRMPNTFSYFGRRNWRPLISNFVLRGLQLVPSGPAS